ncbi:MAG TPA: M24 family metallopeptidase [Syntrophorhabdaceae bacterium]|nr:M24 family metallopeptidase [Syntrophorhabdaceae bacterium]
MSFSLNERDRRYEAIRRLMREAGLDNLVIVGRDSHTARGNLRYVSNHGVNFGEQYCLFPVDSDPVFLGSPIASSHVRRAGWIHDCVDVTGDSARVIEEISRRSHGDSLGLVGIQHLPVPLYLSLREAFPRRIVDSISIFKQLRLVKSQEEIATIRDSATIADRAYAAVRETLQAGISDYEIYGEVSRVIHSMGCEYSMNFIDGEAAKINFFYPVGNVLRADSTLALEITPSREGYYAQLTVTIPVTEYPAHIEPLLPVWREALDAGVAFLKPGIKADKIDRVVTEVVHKHGYTSPLRAGHGIGLDALEFFSFSATDNTELMPGMTVAFHPCIATQPGQDGIGMGYTYLITDEGAEKLSQVTI